MKPFLLSLILFFLIPFWGIAQNQTSEENDVITKMCSEFKNSSQLSDSLRVENMYIKALFPYLRKIQHEKVDSIANALYYRLQKECPEFRVFLLQQKGTQNWEVVETMPTTNFSKEDQKEFNHHKDFYYYEGSTAIITKVKIKNNEWIDEFPDKTYSKNTFAWKNNSEFILTHVESNNEGRKAFSHKGDQYFYTLINKKENYYTVAAQIPNQKEILLFKLYIK